MTKLEQRKHSIRDKELRKCLGIGSLNEILDRRRVKWMEKIANMPATLDDIQLPRQLLGDWCIGGERQSDAWYCPIQSHSRGGTGEATKRDLR